MSGRSVVLRASLLLAAVGVAGLLFISLAPAGDSAPHPFNHDRNAVWLEHRWLEREHGAAEMEALFASLSRHGDRLRLSPISSLQRRRAAFPSTAASRCGHSWPRPAARRPISRVLPWVGGLRVGYRRQRPGSVDLSDLGQRQRIVAECRGLIDEGFDGIHVNVEPVDDGNDDFLALLRALRTAIGPGRILSVSAMPSRPRGPARSPPTSSGAWNTTGGSRPSWTRS